MSHSCDHRPPLSSRGTRTPNQHVLLFLLSALFAAAALGACVGPGASAPTPEPAPGLPRGQAVFARYCNSCHPGGGRGSGPSLFGLTIGDDQMREVVRKGKKQMPSFSPKLIPDDHLADLITYMRSLK